MADRNDALIDPTLTPQNAKERGYHYIDDVFYDGTFVSPDITELLQEHSYELGKSSKQNSGDLYFGLYAPKKSKP